MSEIVADLKKEDLRLCETLTYPLRDEGLRSVIDFAYKCDDMFPELKTLREKTDLRMMMQYYSIMIKRETGDLPYFPNLESSKNKQHG